jgi:hypothetical protein
VFNFGHDVLSPNLCTEYVNHTGLDPLFERLPEELIQLIRSHFAINAISAMRRASSELAIRGQSYFEMILREAGIHNKSKY